MRRATRMVPNPPWATKALAGTYDALQEKGIPSLWLPKMQDVVPIGGDGVEASLREYGCGVYGCVFPTLDDKVVLKLTADDTEAEFASELASTLVRPICVNYYRVIEPEGAKDSRGAQIYMLWREAADLVGRIDDAVADGDEALRLINNQHIAAQYAYRTLKNASPVDDMERAIAAWLETCEAMARQKRVPELRKLGDGLVEVYRAQHIFFGDIHAGNLGLVLRPDGDHWVITDPGHVAVVTI